MSSVATFASQEYKKEKRESKKTENLLGEIMKKNFPNLVREIDI